MKPFSPWSQEVGFLPHKVTVYENMEKDGTLYLRWRGRDGLGRPQWKKRSLRRPLRTDRGKVIGETQQWAMDQAAKQYALLVGGIPTDEREVVHQLTLAEGIARALKPDTGMYPSESAHRKEVVREMERAVKCLGPETRWDSIKRADLRRLWRWRIQDLRADRNEGLRGAEVTIQRLLAVAGWLRNEELIPSGACVAPTNWKALLLEDWQSIAGVDRPVEPLRPRHSLEEMRKLFTVFGQVDPRFELLMAIGAELRLGQVVRGRRSDLDLEHRTFTVRGRKQKRGTVVELTGGQMAAVERALHPEYGYLRELEANLADYPLFMGGVLLGGVVHRRGIPSKAKFDSWRPPLHPFYPAARAKQLQPLDRSVIRRWFRAAEDRAEIPHIPGRGPYGLRRRAVDELKRLGVSRDAMKEAGGWSDMQMPDRVYADQVQEHARKEAAVARAKVRGETAE